MRQADFYTGGGKLRDAMKSLQAAWLQVDAQWRDNVRDEFEKNYLEPLNAQTLSTIEAVGRLAEILARAQHECR